LPKTEKYVVVSLLYAACLRKVIETQFIFFFVKIVPGRTEASAELSDALGASVDENPAEVETSVEQEAY